MTTTESHLRAWVDQAIRPVLREVLRDELADILPSLRNQVEDTGPNGDFSWLESVFPGTPKNTLRQWDAAGKIPGSFKFGKRKIYHKQTVLDWQRSKVNQTTMSAHVEQQAQEQVSRQLSKKKGGGL